MVPIHVPSIGIVASHVAVMELLEDAMVLDDPAKLGGDVRPHNRGDHLAVRVRRELIADVMQQSGGDVFLAATVSLRPRRRLQRVFVAAHLIAGERALQPVERRQEPRRQLAHKFGLRTVEQLKVCLRAAVHRGERDLLHLRCST